MLVNISTLLLQFEKCIVIDICDTLAPPLAHTLAADIFFTFPPAGPQTKGLVKQQADFPTQLFKEKNVPGSEPKTGCVALVLLPLQPPLSSRRHQRCASGVEKGRRVGGGELGAIALVLAELPEFVLLESRCPRLYLAQEEQRAAV